MIGSFVIGGLVFSISDPMFSDVFNVLIKILKVYRHHIPSDRTLLVTPLLIKIKHKESHIEKIK